MAGGELPQVQLVSSDRRGPDAADGGLLAMVVGRRPGCEVVLPHASISEIHACLVRRPDGLWLYDLGSRNGIRVGHTKVKEKAVRHKDYIEFGSLRYEVRLTGSAAKSAGDPAPASLRNTATGQIERLKQVVSVVGRRHNSHVRLAGGEISHVHALLIRCPDGLIVHDLGSRTGTFVNGSPEREAFLTGGEKLAFGQFEFEVQLETSPAIDVPTAENVFLAGPATLTDSIVEAIAVATPTPDRPGPDRGAAKEETGKNRADDVAVPGASPWTEDSVLMAALNRRPDAPAAAPPEPAVAETDALDQTLRFLSDKTDIQPVNVELLDLGLSAVSPAAVNPFPLGEDGPTGPGEELRPETVPPLDPDHKIIEIPLAAPVAAPPAAEQSALAPLAITDTIAHAEQAVSPLSVEVPSMPPPSSPQGPTRHMTILPTELRPARRNMSELQFEDAAPLAPPATAPAASLSPPAASPKSTVPPSPEQRRIENELEAVRRHLAAERAAVAAQRAALDAQIEDRRRREQEEIAARDERRRRDESDRADHEAARQALEAVRQRLQGERDAQAEALKALEIEQRKVDALRDELQAFHRELQNAQQDLAAERHALEAERQALADNRAALETEQQRLLTERQHVAAEQQVATQEQTRLEQSRRELADGQQNIDAAKADLDARLAAFHADLDARLVAFNADSQRLQDDRQSVEQNRQQVLTEAQRLAADREAVSQHRRKLDEERAALIARQEQLVAQHAEVEEQSRRLGDLKGNLDRREADLAASQASADERTAKLENAQRKHAENVVGFQRLATQTEERRQDRLTEEQARVRAAAVAAVAPSHLGEGGPSGPGEGLRPKTAPLIPLHTDQAAVALDPPSSIFADTVQDLRAGGRGRLAQPQQPHKRRFLVALLAVATVVLAVVAVLIFVLTGDGGTTSAPPSGPVRAPAVAPNVVVNPSPVGEGGPPAPSKVEGSGPGEGLSPRPVPTDTAAPNAASPPTALASPPETKPNPADTLSHPAPPPTLSANAEPAKPLIPGGVWPFKPPADLADDKPAEDIKATRKWAGDEMAKNISALRKAYGLHADAGPRQAIAIELGPRLKATLNEFLPPPYAEETISGGDPERVTVLVFLEFLYQGNSYLVVFKRLDQTGQIVPARRGTFTLYPGAIREHTVVLDPTRAPIPEPDQQN